MVLSMRFKTCCFLLIFCEDLLDVLPRMPLAELFKGYLQSQLQSSMIKSSGIR